MFVPLSDTMKMTETVDVKHIALQTVVAHPVQITVDIDLHHVEYAHRLPMQQTHMRHQIDVVLEAQHLGREVEAATGGDHDLLQEATRLEETSAQDHP